MKRADRPSYKKNYSTKKKYPKGLAADNARSGNSAMHPAPRGPSAVEKKHVDVPSATYLVNSTPVFTLVNYVAPASNFFGRDGNAIKARSLYLTGFFFAIRTRASTDYARVLTVWVGAPRGVAPTIAQILSSVDNAGNVTSLSTDHTNVESRSIIKVLDDIRVLLPPVTYTAGVLTNNAQTLSNPDNRFQFERYIKLKDAMVQFNNNAAGTIADFDTGAIYVVTIGSVASGQEGYSVAYSTRFMFKE